MLEVTTVAILAVQAVAVMACDADDSDVAEDHDVVHAEGSDDVAAHAVCEY